MDEDGHSHYEELSLVESIAAGVCLHSHLAAVALVYVSNVCMLALLLL